MIIGIAGKMGCGKDYICNNVIIPLLKNKGKNFLQVSFADQIKVNVMTKQNIKFEDVYISKTNQTRRLLQMEGTENGRNVLGKDIWIKYFDNWIAVYKSRGVDIFICTDVRFVNELDHIKSLGGIIIKIDAPLRNLNRLNQESNGDETILQSLRSHSSECDLDDIPDDYYDLVIKNDPGNNITKYQESINKLFPCCIEREIKDKQNVICCILFYFTSRYHFHYCTSK